MACDVCSGIVQSSVQKKATDDRQAGEARNAGYCRDRALWSTVQKCPNQNHVYTDRRGPEAYPSSLSRRPSSPSPQKLVAPEGHHHHRLPRPESGPHRSRSPMRHHGLTPVEQPAVGDVLLVDEDVVTHKGTARAPLA